MSKASPRCAGPGPQGTRPLFLGVESAANGYPALVMATLVGRKVRHISCGYAGVDSGGYYRRLLGGKRARRLLDRSPVRYFLVVESAARMEEHMQERCGGIEWIKGKAEGIRDLPAAERVCCVCHEGDSQHYCYETEAFIHARCAIPFLQTENGKQIIRHGHQVRLDFAVERREVQSGEQPTV